LGLPTRTGHRNAPSLGPDGVRHPDRSPPPRARLPPASPGVSAVHSQGRAGRPTLHGPVRGVSPRSPPPRAYKSGSRLSPAQAIPGTGQAVAGRFQRCRPPRVVLRSPAGRPPTARVTFVPRASPRRSRAPPPRAAAAAAATAGAPLPSVSHWVSDAAGPSAKRGSPIAIAFIWPPRPIKRRPDWRDASRRLSNHRARRARRRRASPTQSALGTRGRRRVRGRRALL
jgi:hypothetical protein